MGFWIPMWVAKIVAKRVVTYLIVGGVFVAGYWWGKKRKK